MVSDSKALLQQLLLAEASSERLCKMNQLHNLKTAYFVLLVLFRCFVLPKTVVATNVWLRVSSLI